MNKRAETALWQARLAFVLVLAFVFLSFFLIPTRVISLRRRFARTLPDQWAAVTNNGPFRAVLPYATEDLGFSDEGLYAARALQAYRHGLPYGPWSGGRSLKSWIFDCLMLYPIAICIGLCGGNFALGWILTHAVVGACWFAMLFLLFRAYGQDEVYALLISAFVFFFLETLREIMGLISHLVLDPSTIASRLGYLFGTLFMPVSVFMRLPIPGIGFLLLAGGLSGALALGLSPKFRPLTAVFVGAACGLLCFFHFFDWLSCVIAVCALAADSFWNREAGKPGRLNLTAAAAAACAVSAAYYVFAKRLTSGYMSDLIDRSGARGRHFYPVSALYLLFALALWRLASSRRGLRRGILTSAAAVALASFLLSNLSLVLGYDLMFSEHAAHFSAFAVILAFFCWVMEREGLKRRLKPHAYLLVAFLCAWSAFKSKAWADLHFKLYGIPKDASAASEWMNANVPKGSLLLAPSAPATYLLAAEAEMRWPVTIGNPVCGEPVKTDDNLNGLAVILKTLDVDPARFHDERWMLTAERDQARGVAENMTGNMDWRAMEAGEWPLFLLDTSGWRELDREEAWSRVLAAVQEEKPPQKPFYAWIQKEDEPLLRRSPADSGGSLVYRNSSVSLYVFR